MKEEKNKLTYFSRAFFRASDSSNFAASSLKCFKFSFSSLFRLISCLMLSNIEWKNPFFSGGGGGRAEILL